MAFSPSGEALAMPTSNEGELGDLLKESGADPSFDLGELHARDLIPGEKVDEAIDYADISDDDLPDEEDVDTAGPAQEPGYALSGIMDYVGENDDLFGDGPSSPVGVPDGHQSFANDIGHNAGEDSDLASEHGEDPVLPGTNLRQETNAAEDYEFRIQQELFAQIGKSAPVTEQENVEEWVKHDFPAYDPDEIPYFSRLFPPKPMPFIGKTPAKPPKPVRPMKVNLDLDQDQKASFNSTSVPPQRPWEGDDSVVVVDVPLDPTQIDEESEAESDLDETLPGNLTMQDLEIICADFDTLSGIAESDAEEIAGRLLDDDSEMFGYDEYPNHSHPFKKRRLGLGPREIVSTHHFDMPSFEDPERMTQKIAMKVVLDLNDPQLLVEEIAPETMRTRAQSGDLNKGSKSVKALLNERFNHSNDAEYDLLKQNHQHKIRSTLGNLSIDHSVPASRLQFPYYKVKLETTEARKFHRPALLFRPMMPIQFNKPTKVKRKHMKGKKIKEVYPATKDLSLGDNSTALLLEYAEEHPMIMSQVGMGVRVINYYRRRTKDDNARPKTEVGETTVLLPEDKSPFYIFGHIEPGENIKALYNSMYRAPIFEQEARPQDFLVVRSFTGMQGSQYFIRDVDHLYTVGQEFPSVTVPGPHSRVVTTASKNRLKAISYRIIRRKKHQRLRVEDVTRHFPDTTDMQNRQKMKEFMSFSKEHKEWEMKPGEPVPDEDLIQTLIRPEDVCLLESMQVGQQYLHDAGYGQDDDEDDDDAKEGENQTLEQELAPWKTSKNFINATQGKAMLKLHGEGDPSGRGEAFSFIKTSMKGGFKAIGESIMDKMAEKRELGGHSYNVARQQRSYEDSIRRIWDAQKASLSSNIEHSDGEADEGVDGVEDNNTSSAFNKGTPRSLASTPAPLRRQDDESMTSFSKRSNASQNHKLLKIVRTFRRGGQEVTEEYFERDPAVIKQYVRRRNNMEEASSAYGILVSTVYSERWLIFETGSRMLCLQVILNLTLVNANGKIYTLMQICHLPNRY